MLYHWLAGKLNQTHYSHIASGYRGESSHRGLDRVQPNDGWREISKSDEPQVRPTN